MPLKIYQNESAAIVIAIEEILCIAPTGSQSSGMSKITFKNGTVVIVSEYVDTLWRILNS